MDWTKDTIINTVKSLRIDARTLKESEINEKYSELKEKFPKLFYMAMTPNFNIDRLGGLLDYRDKATQDNIPELVRDVTVSEEFAKEYLYPVVGEPTLEQKKIAAKKVAEKYYINKQNTP